MRLWARQAFCQLSTCCKWQAKLFSPFHPHPPPPSFDTRVFITFFFFFLLKNPASHLLPSSSNRPLCCSNTSAFLQCPCKQDCVRTQEDSTSTTYIHYHNSNFFKCLIDSIISSTGLTPSPPRSTLRSRFWPSSKTTRTLRDGGAPSSTRCSFHSRQGKEPHDLSHPFFSLPRFSPFHLLSSSGQRSLKVVETTATHHHHHHHL